MSLTLRQREFLVYRNIKIGSWEALPYPSIFNIYEKPDKNSGFRTISLSRDHIVFVVVESFKDGWYQLKFADLSKEQTSFYITESHMRLRLTWDYLFVNLFCTIPFHIYNFFVKIFKKDS